MPKEKAAGLNTGGQERSQARVPRIKFLRYRQRPPQN